MKDQEIIVAFQGELGAYSELAARELFPEEIEVLPKHSFEEVFGAVEHEECPYGMIPIENSLTGSIHQNYDLLLKHQLTICEEIKLRISHALIVHPGVRLEDVRRVYSHPQALSQCEEFLHDLTNVEAVPVYDTAGAVRMVKEKGLLDAGAIASAQAASDYDLEVLARGIESDHQNFTRFLLLSNDEAPSRPDAKISIVFATRDIPGALFKSLAVFALRDINLLKIESRPLRGQPWEYLFYLDFEGDLQEERCGRAIEHLKEVSTFLRILGCYPKGREVDGKAHRRQKSEVRSQKSE